MAKSLMIQFVSKLSIMFNNGNIIIEIIGRLYIDLRVPWSIMAKSLMIEFVSELSIMFNNNGNITIEIISRLYIDLRGTW